MNDFYEKTKPILPPRTYPFNLATLNNRRRTMATPRLPQALALAGALPFIASAVALWMQSAHAAWITQALATYSAVTLSFLGGIQWGTGLGVSDVSPRSARSLFLLSVAPPILGWVMLCLEDAGTRFIVAVFLFGFAWAIDALLYLQKLLPPWFFRVRSMATAIVVLSLLAALARG